MSASAKAETSPPASQSVVRVGDRIINLSLVTHGRLVDAVEMPDTGDPLVIPVGITPKPASVDLNFVGQAGPPLHLEGEDAEAIIEHLRDLSAELERPDKSKKEEKKRGRSKKDDE